MVTAEKKQVSKKCIHSSFNRLAEDFAKAEWYCHLPARVVPGSAIF